MLDILRAQPGGGGADAAAFHVGMHLGGGAALLPPLGAAAPQQPAAVPPAPQQAPQVAAPLAPPGALRCFQASHPPQCSRCAASLFS